MTPFTGLYTALITPFKRDGSLDEEGLLLLIQRQLQADVDGIVILGTTGEAPTLTDQEKKRVIQLARAAWPKKSLVVGTGTYSTRETIRNTQEAKDLGADCALLVSPYYNKPTQEGLYLHFKAVANAVNIPILLYNIAYRTGVSQHLETILKLAEIENICGIKETSPHLNATSHLIWESKKRRPGFVVLSGDDELNFPIIALGGDGAVSVISNLFPEKVSEMINLALGNQISLAREIHYQLLALCRGASLETNPIPIKAALQSCGLPSGNPRLPLTPLAEMHRLELLKILDTMDRYEKKTAVRAS